MEKRSSSFEDHMSIVDSANGTKTASAQNSQGDGSLLDKLAAELGLGEGTEEKTAASVTAPGAPAAEGEVQPAESSVAGANAAVVGATEAVATPQTTIAGGNPAEAAAGEVPAATKPNEGTAISAGDGKVTDSNNLHKTPEAVAAAAEDGGGDEGSAATPSPEKAGQSSDQSKTAAEADLIGKTIAESFQKHLQKIATDQEYPAALAMLKEAGVLDAYDIKDEGIDKTASEQVSCLEKIAQKQELSREDIVGAAHELIEMNKEAEAAEAQGREDAQSLVALLSKEASTETAAEEAPAASAATEAAPVEGEEKVATLLKDEAVVNAVRVLKDKGVLA